MPLKRSGFKKRTYAEIKAACYPLTLTRRRMKQAMHRLNRELRDKEQALARQCKERDNFKCQWPGGCQTGDLRLDAHHIAERSQRPDLKFELTNLITICRTHHDWIPLHRQEAIEMKLLLDETYEKAMKIKQASSG